MSEGALWWLSLNLLSIILMAFYSMMEMACVSFNKVRLHYYVTNNDKKAKWLNYLLQHPFRLFGTTLIGVNVSMVYGSEFSRQFHSAIGVSPELAPLTQVIIVVVIGELAPMFAARHYAEHVAMLGVPLLYFSARLLTPALWVIGWIARAANWAVGGTNKHAEIFLTQEELQTILEEHGEETPVNESEEFNLITHNIFQLRHKQAYQILESLNNIPRLPSNATIGQMKDIIRRTGASYIVIYYKDLTNVVGIAYPRDLVRIPDSKRVRDYAKQPWFVTQHTSLTEIMQLFQHNNQRLAVILDKKGKAKGILTLDDLLAEIFGEGEYRPLKNSPKIVIERSFSGSMLIKEFKDQFGVTLNPNLNLTLAGLMKEILGHNPEQGDSVYIEPFELIASETTLLEVKTVEVTTKKV